MKFTFNDKEYYIDGFLANQLISLVYNIKKDWDFVIIISGDRTVRVGKSVIGQTVCAFMAAIMNYHGLNTKYDLDDIYFDNKKMMDAVQTKPQYSINHYDEGREGLSASKSMKSFQQDILDFFAECGQLNQVFVIVLPDFFELKEEIGVGRSEFLINVYRKEICSERNFFNKDKPVPIKGIKRGDRIPITKLERGFFEFFNRTKKKLLYDKFRTTRKKNYHSVKANFLGKFTNQYPLGEEEYRAKKLRALSRFKEKKDEDKKPKNKYAEARGEYIYKRRFTEKIPVMQIKKEVEELYGEEISETQIYRISNVVKEKHEKDLTV